jgi:hypothetical protein
LDCVSAADGGGGDADVFLGAGTPIVSNVLGPASQNTIKTRFTQSRRPHTHELHPALLALD